ncbi:general odorant-binding protein 83a-like [Arctopsyche grandis]|uniref:general odorant-binding protein 83a-like n=1 Tax=Arctopsyche grandis TaxID=121162 RepID=UPI00406D6356
MGKGCQFVMGKGLSNLAFIQDIRITLIVTFNDNVIDIYYTTKEVNDDELLDEPGGPDGRSRLELAQHHGSAQVGANLLEQRLGLGVQLLVFPTQEFLDLLKPVVEKCEMMTTVDKQLVQHFSEGKMPDDPKLKCYMKCMFLEFEVLDSVTGTFHYEKMLELIPESMKKIAYNMGKNCIHFKGEDGDDLCQVSFDLHKCWQQSDPEHYFLM